VNKAAPGALSGQRVLVTRASHQAPALADLLAAVGAIPIAIPVMRVDPIGAPERRRRLRGRIWNGEFDDLVFTSANTVRMLLATAPPGPPPGLRVFAIGPGTAAALAEFGWHPQVLPEGFIAESLAARMVALGVSGRRVLLPRAEGARPTLPELLEAAGARVETLALYRMEPELSQGPRLREALAEGGLDWATFTSGSSVSCFRELAGTLPLPEACAVACIGPVTAAALRRIGIEPSVVAPTHSMAGLVEALAASCRRLPENGRRP
jgi:uroporphyrinogen-III synthase